VKELLAGRKQPKMLWLNEIPVQDKRYFILLSHVALSRTAAASTAASAAACFNYKLASLVLISCLFN
jgi:hypothetical protein